jgi:hypothetical protein
MVEIELTFIISGRRSLLYLFIFLSLQLIKEKVKTAGPRDETCEKNKVEKYR